MRHYWLFILALSSFVCLPSSGKQGGSVTTNNSHAYDMASVFGVDTKDPVSKSKWNTLTKCFASYIDSGNVGGVDLMEEIRSVTKNHFKMGSAGHRILFHWGFNNHPKVITELNTQVQLAAQKAEVNPQDVWQVILKEQARRNKEMMNAVGLVYVASKRQQRNAIASILYDTHLLGDYIEGCSSSLQGLPSLNSITTDLIKSVENLGCADTNLVRLAITKLKEADKRNNAQHILNVLIEFIPQIMSKTKNLSKGSVVQPSPKE